MARPSRGFSESIGIWKCCFLRRGDNRSNRRKTSRSKDENKKQTQPTFDAESGNRTRVTLVANAQPLRHPCSPVKKKRLLLFIVVDTITISVLSFVS